MRGELRDILIRRANGEEFDMREWLAIRRLRFYENAERAFANSISQTAMQLSFVRRARVELQTSLGGRKGAGGVDVAGALRETDDDIVGWQLRGYAAEHGAKGLNTGLFYRRVVGGALAGVNVFADYEDGDDGDFWRWSVGGDVKNRLGELSANRYFAITDAQVVGGKTAYTREGYDVDVAVRIPRLEWAKARVGYYAFEGEFGDEDENGFRAGLDLSPGAGLVLGVEYDDDDGKFGGNISYTHHFGETQQGAQRAGEFNPRAHFYHVVRREYSQRISRASGNNNAVIVNAAIDVGVFGGDDFTALTITSGSFQLPATGAVTATTHATGNDGDVTLRQGWELIVGNNARIVFARGESAASATIVVSRGRGSFNRNNANITLMQIGNAVITLLGTRFDFDSANGNITLHEGGLGIPASGVNVEVADMMASVVSGGDIVGCGEGRTVMAAGATAKCEIENATSESVMTEVTEGGGEVLIGRITLAGADAGISAHVSPSAEFSAVKNGAIINVNLLAAAAMTADRNVKVARVNVRGGELQTPKEFVFSVRVNPQPINLIFVGDINNAPLTMAGDITVGTLEVTNGFGAQDISFVGNNGGDFRLDASDAANRRLLVLGGDNTRARTVSVVALGDDNESGRTPAATLSVAVTVADALRIGGGMFTILADTSSLPLITISAVGGERPHSYSATETPSGTHPAVAAAGSGPYTISKTGMQQTANADLRWIYQVTDSRNSVAAATVDVSVVTTISLSASNLIAEAQRGAITTNILQTLGTLGAVGGLGNYVFTSSDTRASLVDMSVMVLDFTAAAQTTVHYIIDDRNADNTAAPITPPVTFFVTVNAVQPLAIQPLVVTFTTGSGRSGPIQTPSPYRINASGGEPPYTYSFDADPFGPFLSYGNRSNPVIEWSGQQIRNNAGTDNNNFMTAVDSATPQNSTTLRVTIIYVNPPSGG